MRNIIKTGVMVTNGSLKYDWFSIDNNKREKERKPLSIAIVDRTLRVALLNFIARKFYYFSVRNVARLHA